jgi:hypothetical protein
LLTIEEKLEAAPAATSVHILEVRRSVTPSLQDLRADKTLSVQAEKLAEDIQFS